MSTSPEENIVRREEWPGGLCCGECHQKMNDGDRYSEKLTGMVGGIPVVEIVCVPCALPDGELNREAAENAL